MHEVEYILWVLSSKEEGDDPANTDEESACSDEDSVGTDCTMVEDDKACMYSLEKLLSFPSLHKVCGDIQKLRLVFKASCLRKPKI